MLGFKWADIGLLLPAYPLFVQFFTGILWLLATPRQQDFKTFCVKNVIALRAIFATLSLVARLKFDA